MVLATIAVSLRLAARQFSTTKYGIDDILIILALVSGSACILHILKSDENHDQTKSFVQSRREPKMVIIVRGYMV